MQKLYILITLIVISLLAMAFNNHMPLASFKIPVTDTITVKVLVYDSKDGVLQMTLRNVKTVASMYNETP